MHEQYVPGTLPPSTSAREVVCTFWCTYVSSWS